MYHNNSNRGLTEAYNEQVQEQVQKERDFMVEKLTKSILSVVNGREAVETDRGLVGEVQDRLDQLDRYDDDIHNNPSSFKMFITDMETEYRLVDQAKLSASRLIKRLNAIQATLSQLDMKPDTRAEVEAERDLVDQAKINVMNAVKELKKFQQLITDFQMDF